MTTNTTPAAPTTPAPTNGVKPQTPTAPTTPPPASATPPPDATAAELKQWQERAKKAESERDLAKREEVVNRRKWDSEKKTFGEKLKEADEYSQLKKHAGVNPAAVAKKLWGDQWYEKLTAINVNGGAPTADSIAFELEQREQKLRQEFADKEAEREKAAQAREQQALDARLRAFNAQAVEYAKDAVKEFEALEQLGTPESIGAALVAHVRHVHDSTIQRDPDTGAVVKPGRVVTLKEAAEAIENHLLGLAEKVAEKPKYQEKLRAKLTPAKTPASTSPVVKSSQASSQGSQSLSQPRRTLGNDLTGSTPPAPSKYRTEEQRTADALAAYERHKKV